VLATKGEEDFRKANGDEAKFDELFSGFLVEAIAEIKNTFAQLKTEVL